MSTASPDRYAQLTADVVAAADHGLQGFVDHIDRDDLGAELVTQAYRDTHDDRAILLTHAKTRIDFTAVQLRMLSEGDGLVAAAAELMALASELLFVTTRPEDVGSERSWHLNETADDLIDVAQRVRKDGPPAAMSHPIPSPKATSTE